MARYSAIPIETSVTDATLALAYDGQITASRSFSSERSQECDLFSRLQDILAQLPDGERLTSMIVGTGPGSYNGTRVGIAAAQALAQVHGCGVAGLCSFEGVAAVHEAESAWAVGDARRGSFFIMPLVKGRPTSAPELLGEADFQTRLTRCHGPKVTFESPDRLPGGHDIVKATSAAEILVKSWLTRTPEEMQALQNIPAEAFYLRPPHITKSKKKAL